MRTVPGRMSVIRAGTTTRPRRELNSTQSPSVTPARAASGAEISTHGAGAAASNCGARAVLVRVWK